VCFFSCPVQIGGFVKKLCCLLSCAISFAFITACGPSQEEIEARNRAQQQAIVEAAEKARLARVAAEQARILQQFQECIGNALEKDDAAQGNVYTMKSISLATCPTDFRQVYQTHIYAWEDAKRIDTELNRLNSDDNVIKTLTYGGLCELFSCPATPIQDAVDADRFLRQKREEASTAIRETYRAVEITAVKYGVSLKSPG
jgi:hypothetical protein